MATTIHQVTFIESGDFSFRVEFLYQGAAMSTQSVDRTITASELRQVVLDVISHWESNRASDNFETLKNLYEKDVLVIP